MYAIIRDRNQQEKVQQGDVLRLDLDTAHQAGDQLVFDQVLLVGHEGQIRTGKPLVEGASVTAEVLGVETGPKVIAFRFKRRKGVRRKRGFRARYTRVRITGIQA